jgi:tetratricopeptide (TPR) repeat protein
VECCTIRFKAVRFAGAVLLLSAALCTAGCVPSSSGEELQQRAGNQLQEENLHSLWGRAEYVRLHTVLQDKIAARSALTLSENLYLGFTAYRLYEKTGELEYLNQAVTALERFRLLAGTGNEQLSQQLEESRRVLAGANFLLGSYERALQHAGGEDREGSLLIIAALSHYNLGNFEEAYTVLSEQNGYHVALLAYLAAEAAGMTPEACSSLETAAGAAENERERYTAVILLAECAAAEGDYPRARAALQTLRTSLSDPYLLSSVSYTVSTFYRRQGMLIEAQAMIRQALEYNPDNNFAREWL